MSATTRPPFAIRGTADIKHINIRKEGPEDDKILAVDVKLSFKKMDRRLCAYFDEALEAFLWRGDTDALIVRNAMLAPVEYGNTIKDATVKLAGHTFMGCEVKKFAIAPSDGGVIDLVCAVSIYPSSHDMSDIARIVQEAGTVEIEGPPDLFDASQEQETQSSDLQGMMDAVGDDPVYEQAVALVVARNKASISLVQRELHIGYNRAARLLDAMEQKGVVSHLGADGSRMVLTGGAV